jgi:hypothetical protein
LKPQEFVGKILIGMSVKQDEDSPKQLPERNMIRDDDPS